MRSLLLLLGLCLAQPVWARSGMSFLQLPSGARGAALAEAGVALPDADALSANPAALQSASRTLGLTHGEWVQGIRHEYLSLLWGHGPRVLGLAFQLSHTGQLEQRTGPSTEPLGEFGVYEGALSLAWARSWSPRLRLGLNLKLLRQSVYTATATGAALDLGFLFQLHPDFRLGAALRQLGRMDELDQVSTPLPRTLAAGLAYTGLPRLLLSGEVRRVDGSTTLHLGGEWEAASQFLLRGGYQSAEGRGLALGLGLRREAWALDYAFVPLAADLGNAHRLSLHLHREGAR
ncbi:MAG: PorV/PorQ family protein [Candidatus Latescibacteria bacterium]|nr:PorV/PorQ family protein [Candidatus Latescibacterota bacterium]